MKTLVIFSAVLLVLSSCTKEMPVPCPYPDPDGDPVYSPDPYDPGDPYDPSDPCDPDDPYDPGDPGDPGGDPGSCDVHHAGSISHSGKTISWQAATSGKAGH